MAERFERFSGGRLVEGYGLSETSPVAIANPIYGKRKAGTIGMPIPDTLARVADPTTLPRPCRWASRASWPWPGRR